MIREKQCPISGSVISLGCSDWSIFFIKNQPGVNPLGMYHPPIITKFYSTYLPSFSGGFLQVFLPLDYPLRPQLPPDPTNFSCPSLPVSSDFDMSVPWCDIGSGCRSASTGCSRNQGEGGGWWVNTRNNFHRVPPHGAIAPPRGDNIVLSSPIPVLFFFIWTHHCSISDSLYCYCCCLSTNDTPTELVLKPLLICHWNRLPITTCQVALSDGLVTIVMISDG